MLNMVNVAQSTSFIHHWKAVLMLNLKDKSSQDNLLMDFEKIDGLFGIFL